MDHFTSDLLRRWREGSLEPEESLAVSDHLEQCEPCGRLLADDAAAAAIAADVAGQLEATAAELGFEHLSSEQVERWVDGGLEDAERERIGLHLADCASCRDEVADLRAFAVDWSGSMSRRVPLRAAAIAASVVLLIVAATVLVRRPSPDPRGARPAGAAPSRPPATVAEPSPALVLRDGTRLVRMAADGTLEGVAEPWREEIMSLLRDPAPRLPAAVVALARTVDPERSTSGQEPEEPAVVLLAPRSVVVIGPRPQFRWAGPRDASYRVEIYDSDFDLVASSGEVRGQQWRADKTLPAGRQLQWKLVVRHPSGQVASYPQQPAAPAVFELLPAAEAEKVAAATRTGSHLVAGWALWRAGVVDAGAREWAELARKNPDSPVAGQLAAAAARAVAELRQGLAVEPETQSTGEEE